MNNWSQVPGMMVSVEEGTANHDTVWLSTGDPGGTIGTTPITFAQIPGPSDILAERVYFGPDRSSTSRQPILLDGQRGQRGREADPARAITLVAGGIGANAEGTTVVISANTIAVKPNLFLSASNCTIRETVGGTIDGVNTAFTLAAPPNPANTEQIYLNGVLQEPGAGNDYTISSQNITFLSAPPAGSRIKASYFNRGIPYSSEGYIEFDIRSHASDSDTKRSDKGWRHPAFGPLRQRCGRDQRHSQSHPRRGINLNSTGNERHRNVTGLGRDSYPIHTREHQYRRAVPVGITAGRIHG